MKTTIPGYLYLPKQPKMDEISVSKVSDLLLLETPSDNENSFLQIQISKDKHTQILTDLLRIVDQPPDMISFEQLFAGYKRIFGNFSSEFDFSVYMNEIQPISYLLYKLISFVELISLEQFPILIQTTTTFIQFINKYSKNAPQNAVFPQNTPLKPIKMPSSKPVIKSPHFSNKNIKIVQPRVVTNKSYILHAAALNDVLPPLSDDVSQHTGGNDDCLILLKLLLSKSLFYCYKRKKLANEELNDETKEYLTFLTSNLLNDLNKTNETNILTKIYSAASLSTFVTHKQFKDFLTQEQIMHIYDLLENEVHNILTDEKQTKDYIQYYTQIISLVRILSDSEDSQIRTKICTQFYKILDALPTSQNIVLNVLQYFCNAFNDTNVRNAIISQFECESILTLFLELLSNFKNNENIITRVCYVLYIFNTNEFDFQNIAAELKEPISIAVTLQILPELQTVNAANAVLSLIGSFAKNKQCIPILRDSITNIFTPKSIFYEAKVAVNVIALSRIFVQNGENIRQKELESRIEDWLSVEDDSVVEGALSLVFELCKFEMTPFDLLQAILPFVGDDKPNLSYLAIHILSCSAEDPNLEQLGPKIDMRIKKTISVEELDEGTVHDLAEFIIHAPRSIFSQSTLDDCCAFDDLAIATV